MRKNKLFLGVFILFVLFSQISAQSVPGDEKIPADLIIKLERTGCFGDCPAYSLTITADGKVEFERSDCSVCPVQKNLAPTGAGSISEEDLKMLILAFEKINFFKLKKSYAKKSDGCKEVWTDNASEIISIRMNGKEKTVSHYFGCEKVQGNVLENIINLGALIDELVNTNQWINNKRDSENKIIARRISLNRMPYRAAGSL